MEKVKQFLTRGEVEFLVVTSGIYVSYLYFGVLHEKM